MHHCIQEMRCVDGRAFPGETSSPTYDEDLVRFKEVVVAVCSDMGLAPSAIGAVCPPPTLSCSSEREARDNRLRALRAREREVGILLALTALTASPQQLSQTRVWRAPGGGRGVFGHGPRAQCHRRGLPPTQPALLLLYYSQV